VYTRFGRTLIFYFFFTQPDHVGVRAERASAMPRAFTFLRSSDNLLSLRWWLGAIFLFPSYTNDMKFIVGNKIGMTQIFNANGITEAATVLKVPKISVVQVKNQEKDGYDAVQIGFGERKAKNIKKPQQGHTKGLGNFVGMTEFRFKTAVGELKAGDSIEPSVFAEGEEVAVSGVVKGRGFQGVVKRHGFAGGSRTHGQKHSEREPGAIGGGARAGGRVAKGLRMAGRMGGNKITVKNLSILGVDLEQRMIYLKGAVPGARGSLIRVVANK